MSGGMRRWTKTLALVLLLALDSAITWNLSTRHGERAKGAPAVHEDAKDSMAAFRLEREQLQARQEAELKDIIYSQDSDDQIKAQAQRQLMALLEHVREESAIEGLLQSRGYEEVLVSISDASANVLIRDATLTARESAVILELVMGQTGLTGGNVKIVPVK